MMSHLSSNIFARLETLKKWQEVQQERLLKQQIEQNAFLSTQQKRLTEAFESTSAENTSSDISLLSPVKEEISTDNSSVNIEEKFISPPEKNFNELLDEKLKHLEENEDSIKPSMSKPKKPFLKKGTGLARFRITEIPKPISNQNSARRSILHKSNNAINTNKNKMPKIDERASWAKVLEQTPVPSPNQDHSIEQRTFEKQLERELELKKELENEKAKKKELERRTINYQLEKEQEQKMRNDLEREILIKAELERERTKKSDIKKQLVVKNQLEKEKLMKQVLERQRYDLENVSRVKNNYGRENTSIQDFDELRIFELLEQKALNSSFCSTSSVITRLLGVCTPVRSNSSSPSKSARKEQFSSTIEEPEKEFRDESTWESDSDESESSTLSESSTAETESSAGIQFMDAATNTAPLPEPANTELLRNRLEQLEREIETFREENSKANRLRNELDKEKIKFTREMDVQRKQMEEERKKVQREKQLLADKYTRELKNGTRKEREELTAIKNQLAAVKEELKLKESRFGASQARQRNQLRSLEKEVAALKAENDQLRRENGKIQAQIQQNVKKQQPPTDTKVLHEINRNLTLLTKQQRRRTLSGSTTPTSDKENEITENERSDKKTKKDDLSRSTINPTFESVAKDYERVFGTHKMDPLLRMDGRASSEGTDDISDRRHPQTQSTATADRVERLLPDGNKEITYSNGNIKTISVNKVTMRYYNGDMKETNSDNATVRYYYSEANIWHTTYAEDGLEVLEFPDGQVEKRKRDGNTEVIFPDGCIRCTSPRGTETVSFTDGTVVVNKPEGDKVLTLPNGQKEIHTVDHKRREYPDGTVKLLYPDGTQETRYANGRIRLKDINGLLIMDTADV